jgi:hypothetical protein
VYLRFKKAVLSEQSIIGLQSDIGDRIVFVLVDIAAYTLEFSHEDLWLLCPLFIQLLLIYVECELKAVTELAHHFSTYC